MRIKLFFAIAVFVAFSGSYVAEAFNSPISPPISPVATPVPVVTFTPLPRPSPPEVVQPERMRPVRRPVPPAGF